MARAGTTKAYNTFVAGLVTEATGLSYPENSAKDIDNLDIYQSGKLSRRLGLDREPSGTNSSQTDFASTGLPNTNAYGMMVWEGAAQNANTNLIVVQTGNKLSIYNPASGIISAGLINTITLTSFAYNGASTAAQQASKVSGVSGKGFFWMVGSAYNPFYLSYDPVGNTVTTNVNSPIYIRDFVGVNDSLAVDEQPATLTALHEYNLYNQGWYKSKKDAYFTSQAKYPANSQVWFYAKNDTDDFDPAELVKIDFSNSQAPKGRFLMDALIGDRDANGVGTDLFTTTQSLSSDELASAAFTTTAFFAGRIWYSGDTNTARASGVYFSKLLISTKDATKCYQEASPTAEQINDIVDTDGGAIFIPEAGVINRLEPLGSGILVFSNKGVWFIRGSDAGFTATNYSVDQISKEGCIAPDSVVSSEGSVLYWADSGIYIVSLDVSGPKVDNIAQKTILSYYTAIPKFDKIAVHGFYNKASKCLYWQFRNDATTDTTTNQYFFTKVLVFDAKIGAFYKYSVEEFAQSPESWKTSAGIYLYISTSAANLDNVIDGANNVVDGSDQVVTFSADTAGTAFSGQNIYLLLELESTNKVRHAFGKYYQRTLLDFGSIRTAGGLLYSSYIETGDEALEELQRDKQITYVHSFFERTEMNIDSINPIVYDFPSSCLMSIKWAWNISDAGGRWSDPKESYRFRRPVTNPMVGLFDNGQGVVYSKTKVRGQGRAFSLRYESVSNKDFRLLGFSLPITSNAL